MKSAKVSEKSQRERPSSCCACATTKFAENGGGPHRDGGEKALRMRDCWSPLEQVPIRAERGARRAQASVRLGDCTSLGEIGSRRRV